MLSTFLKKYIIISAFVVMLVLVVGLLVVFQFNKYRRVRNGTAAYNEIVKQADANRTPVTRLLLSKFKYNSEGKYGAAEVPAFPEQLMFIGVIKEYNSEFITLKLGGEDLKILFDTKSDISYTQYNNKTGGIKGYTKIQKKDLKVGDRVAVRAKTSESLLIALEVQKLIE